jgi:creatinine amidohydrolase
MIVMIPEKGKPILWEEMTWMEVEQFVKKMDMAILPTAATEQHGPHLPLAVDTIDCYEVAKRISARLGIPVLPPICYGCSQSHGDFPGTISLRPETVTRTICEIAEWLYKAGIRKLLILNGHMWNWGPIYSARENIRYDYRDMQVRVLNWWETTEKTMKKLVDDCSEQPMYLHANIAETSCMLAIRPDLVSMDKAVDDACYTTFFEHRMDQYTKTGIAGAATTKSTKEYGEELLSEVVDQLVEKIQKGLTEEPANK